MGGLRAVQFRNILPFVRNFTCMKFCLYDINDGNNKLQFSGAGIFLEAQVHVLGSAAGPETRRVSELLFSYP